MRVASTVLACFVALALLVPSGAAPVPKAAKKPPSYFPLRLGDRWEYRDSREQGVVPHEVTRVTEHPDGTSTVEVSSGSPHPAVTVTYRVTLEEVEETHLGTDKLDRPVRVVTTELTPGERWKTSLRVNQNDYTFFWRVGEPTTVTVPAGTFRAVPVTCGRTDKAGDEDFTRWYADGVGMVKMETRDGVATIAQELVRFVPGTRKR